jgi:hypothetical protein
MLKGWVAKVLERWVAKMLEGWVAKMLEGCVAMLAARLIVTASSLGSNLDVSLKNHNWATYAKEWPTHYSPQKETKRV